MKRFSESFAVKSVLYLIMLFCVTASAMAGVCVAVNVGHNWYSLNSKDVKKEIYESTAENAGDSLIQMYYETLDYDGNVESYFDTLTLIDGEGSSTQFGYGIYVADGKSDTEWRTAKEVNADLKESESTYVYNYHNDSGLKIDIFLGDLDGGDIPGSVKGTYDFYKNVYDSRGTAAAVTAIGIFFSIVLMVILVCIAGSDREKKSLIKKLPMDLLLVISIIAFTGAIQWMYAIRLSGYNYLELLFSVGIMALILTVIASAVILIFTVQVKAGTWVRSTVIYKAAVLMIRLLKVMCRFFINAFRDVSLVWKAGIAVATGLFINLILMIMAINSYGAGGGVMFLWFLGAALTASLIIYISACLKRLMLGGIHIAEGDLDYRIDTKGMFLDLKKHADDLNDIRSGISKAVEEKLRSERFKTELITNVSHDIKTPITSIINYVDFLKKEDIQNEKAQEYIEVLDRQSQRMKKLTEDLVEASKAATGNVKLELEPCDAQVMMMQVMGEYQERAESEGLEIISSMPPDNIRIMADGQSLWRVFNNLFSNICKYSQPGTRVYQILEEKDGKAVITYKNISKYELNISSEELTERFVRGDSSRHTEGSGLGLSIARNLIELQGGRFNIFIDGDLFKVVIEFDVLESYISDKM